VTTVNLTAVDVKDKNKNDVYFLFSVEVHSKSIVEFAHTIIAN